MSDLKINLHKFNDSYIGELQIAKPKEISQSNSTFIAILDISGSMGQNVQRIITNYLPSTLRLLGIKEDEEIHLITFESSTEYMKIKLSDMEKSPLKARGGTNMSNIFQYLKEIIKDENTSYRILTISDGEVWDQQETLTNACNYKNTLSEKYMINSQAIRFFTSSSQPDTTALSSVLQFNNVSEVNLIDINYSTDPNIICSTIASLFENDGIGVKINLYGKNLRKNPWNEKSNEISLNFGKNVFWVDDMENLKIKIGDNVVNCNVEIGEEINDENISFILKDKINSIINKLKVLKIVNTDKTKLEMEKIVESFKDFEKILTNSKTLALKDNKLSSRVIFIKKLIRKRQDSIINQFKQILNDDKINQLNSQQKADYLRNIDNSKSGKGLAKRAFEEGIDFDSIAREEVKNMAKHINELNDIDDSNHLQSFYSISTTLEGIKTVCELSKESEFDEIEINDIVKLLNIVGIGVFGIIGNYPDPFQYKIKKVYSGCYISLSDILTVEEINNQKIEAPGIKEEINNVIPIFNDERIHKFLNNYCPKLLEYISSIGMRRILSEVPCTFEATLLIGNWKMLCDLTKNRSEINVKNFIEVIKNTQFQCGKHYLNVLKFIENYKKENNLSMYLNNYGFACMLSPIYELAKNNKVSKENIQAMLRAIFQFEIYQVIRGLIRKSEDQTKFISESINNLLSIDFDKHGTKLPPLFEKNLNPVFYDNYEINKEKLNEYKKTLGWTNFISQIYLYYQTSLSEDPIKAFKELPEYNDELIKSNFGINYDLDSFIVFNIVQSFIFKEKIDRVNDEEQKMKIIDLSDFEVSNKFIKDHVKGIYASKYAIENQKQIKNQLDIISKELVNLLLSSQTKEEFINLMKNGITKGYLTHIIQDESTKGYIELKNGILDESKEIPLRIEKIELLIAANDENNNVIWNKGNPLRAKLIDYKKLVEKLNPGKWKEILNKIKGNTHKYREKVNRQGHSNEKPSYWALGFETLSEMVDAYQKEEVEKYKLVHNNCCGLAEEGKSLKEEKKKLRKIKRKNYKKQKK